ncbi:MAG: carboxypeptidase-like regulatory domain-containing protein [Cyclobacteriaceae bacterium]
MLKSIFSIFLIVSVAFCAAAQDFSVVRGVVTEEGTGDPVPFANVIYPAGSTGTATNNNGTFIFKMDDLNEGDTLVISSMGYAPYVLLLGEIDDPLEIEVSLTPSVITLDEVVIRPPEAMSLLNSALAAIPDNYATDPVMMKGFYRETIKLDQSLISLSEAVIGIYKAPYNNNSAHDQMQLLKGRKNSDIEESEVLDKMSISGGLRVDFIKYGLHPIKPEAFKFYNYEVQELFMSEGDTTYVIAFDQKDGVELPLLKGKIYIDAPTMAFSGIEYGISPKGIKYANNYDRQQKKDMKKAGFSIETVSADTKVNFVKKGDLWFLQSAISMFEGKISRKRKSDQVIRYRADFVVTETDTENVEPIPQDKQMVTFGLDLSKQIGENYDEDFWENYNYIIADQSIRSLSDSLLNKNQ